MCEEYNEIVIILVSASWSFLYVKHKPNLDYFNVENAT